MRLAAVSSKSILGDVKQNLSTTIEWIEELSRQEIDFILFPELNLSGYTKNIKTINAVLNQKEIVFRELLQLSEQIDSAFAVGFPEKSEEKYYISHFLFHKGKLLGKHRKTHLGSTEKDTFTEGNEINVFEADKLKIGIQLCYETHFPEISYIQAKQGANILAMAYASPKENSDTKLERFKRFLPARAYDNSCFIMACNMDGVTENKTAIPPLALIINPKGEILTQTKQECSIVATDLKQTDKIHQSRMAYFNKWKRVKLFQEYYSKNEIETVEDITHSKNAGK